MKRQSNLHRQKRMRESNHNSAKSTFSSNTPQRYHDTNSRSNRTHVNDDNVFRPQVAEHTSKDIQNTDVQQLHKDNNNNNDSNRRFANDHSNKSRFANNLSSKQSHWDSTQVQPQGALSVEKSNTNNSASNNYVRANEAVSTNIKNNIERSTRSIGINRKTAKQSSIVVILEKAGLVLGQRGLVDAYDRAITTEITNQSLRDVRPDIVHQCLLALFDSTLAYEHQLRVYINVITSHNLSSQRKVIEVSPSLRPPRTLVRFKGVMAELFKNGRVVSQNNEVLLRLLPTSIAPVIPYGARVTCITNSLLTSSTANEEVITFKELAERNEREPVCNSLQGGIKDVTAFYVISCTDDVNLDGIDYATERVCCSAYPMTSHVMCARLCEAHNYVRRQRQQQEEPQQIKENSENAEIYKEERRLFVKKKNGAEE